jgi:hypothetical protein|tara:strand:- start:248 stop:397 length:150 start_codon:yes stop_codon:yes gene_type:complete
MEKTFDDLILPIFHQRLSKIDPKAKIKKASKKHLDEIVEAKFLEKYFNN